MVTPPDERSLSAAHALADHIRRLALERAEEDGTRDVSRWLERHSATKKDTWNRRFTYVSPINYTEISEAAEALGMTVPELIRGAGPAAVGGDEQDASNVTPITRKRPEEMTAEELEQQKAAATHDASDPQEYPEG